MTDAPKVSLHEWIRIGPNGLTDGLVLLVRQDGSLEIGYHQNRSKAIGEDVIWNGEHWQFRHAGLGGRYLRGAEEAMVKRGPYG